MTMQVSSKPAPKNEIGVCAKLICHSVLSLCLVHDDAVKQRLCPKA